MARTFRCTSVNPRPPHKISPEARAGTLAAGVRLYTTAFHARATQPPSNPRSAASSYSGYSANGNDIPLYVGQPTTAAQGHQLFCRTYFARDIKTYTAIHHPKQATSQSQHQCQRLFCRTYFSIDTKIYTTIHQHQTSNKPITSPP